MIRDGKVARVNPDVETYGYYIRKQISSIEDCLRGLSKEQINWKPSVDGGNSAFVIATHVLGNARAWVLGIVCGEDIRRNRPAEFASSGSFSDFEKAAQEMRGRIQAALRQLDASRLDERFRPPQELWGEGEPQQLARRSALADVLEHASIHLGQIQLTRDLARRAVSS